MPKLYLVELVGDLEPVIYGAYLNVSTRDAVAKRCRSRDPLERNGLYKLNIEDNVPEMIPYSAAFFEETNA